MADLDLLSMLKIDLGFKTNGYDDRLNQLLTVAEKEIIREGAETLDKTDLDDAQLIVMYAAWLWRKRDTQDGMPRMVRYAINNRVFSEKMAVDNS
jgi:hypothetical protein